MTKDFIPHQDSVLDEWEVNFIAKLAVHGPTLGIDPALVTAVTSSVTAHHSSYSAYLTKQAEAKAATEDKMAKRATAIAIIRDIAQKCKTSSAYSGAIGDELGIKGVQQTIAVNFVKPEVTHISVQLDKIIFDWKKGHMDGIVIFSAKRTLTNSQVAGEATANSGENGQNPAGNFYPQNLIWEEIGRDFRSPYEDKRLNLGMEPEIRFYKLRYLYKDQIVGIDSDIVKVVTEIYSI